VRMRFRFRSEAGLTWVICNGSRPAVGTGSHA
jgi:hypothetical protein